MAKSANRVQDRFLCPHQQDKEIVVLTDENASSAIFATNRGLHALSSGATKILRASFMEDQPSKLPVILSERDEGETAFAAQWIDEVVKQGTFRLLASRPKLGANESSAVRAGGTIKLTHFTKKREVKVEHNGRLERRVVGGTLVHWYTSAVAVAENAAMLGMRYPASASSPYPVSVNMRVARAPGGLGANCSVCGACGGCGACGACALCAGVNFGVALTAAVAVDATLALANASYTFEMLRAESF